MTDAITTCFRHDDRRAGVRCQRCERPICPDCMVQASVGFHCVECARRGRQKVHTTANLPGSGTPWVTQLLIAANLAAFVTGLFYGATFLDGGGDLQQWGALTSVATGLRVEQNGVEVLYAHTGVGAGEYWRLITAGFLHAGIVHLLMNMLVLYLLGPQLERALGRLDFSLVYITSLLGGAFGALLLTDPVTPTVGASGAIFGLFGAAIALQRNRGINPWQSGIGTLVVINLVITFTIPGISIGGHVGGLIAGFASGWLLVELEERTKNKVLPIVLCVVLAGAFVGGGIWAANYAVENLQPVLG